MEILLSKKESLINTSWLKIWSLKIILVGNQVLKIKYFSITVWDNLNLLRNYPIYTHQSITNKTMSISRI